jgi:hypothetical protein
MLGTDVLIGGEQGAAGLQGGVAALDELPGWTLLRRLDQGDVDAGEDDPLRELLLAQLPVDAPAPQFVAQPVQGRPVWVQGLERPRQLRLFVEVVCL